MILGVHFQGLINQTQIYLILRKQVNRGGGSVNPHRVINVGDFKFIIIGNTEDFINQIIINMILILIYFISTKFSYNANLSIPPTIQPHCEGCISSNVFA